MLRRLWLLVPLLEAWRDHYNTQHPHGSLGRRTASEFAAHWKEGTPIPDVAILRSQLDQEWGAPHADAAAAADSQSFVHDNRCDLDGLRAWRARVDDSDRRQLAG